jgi:hypothetical protein
LRLWYFIAFRTNRPAILHDWAISSTVAPRARSGLSSMAG